MRKRKWSARQKIVLVAVLVLGLPTLLLGGSLLNLWHNYSELRRLTQKKARLEAAHQQLLAEKKRLEEKDPHYMELLARTRYHMVRPGEIEFRFDTHAQH